MKPPFWMLRLGLALTICSGLLLPALLGAEGPGSDVALALGQTDWRGTDLAPAQPRNQDPASPYCADHGCIRTRRFLHLLCDYIVANKATVPTIFIGGYYMRTLVAGFHIFGDKRYLETAVAYADYLLKHQLSNGVWATGYGKVYLADTGSALGLFAVLYKDVDHRRREEYLDAVQRYIHTVQQDGMILPQGALGTGWRTVQGDAVSGPIRDQYTISSALTGGEIFTWMYDRTGDKRFRTTAYRALRWVLSTMAPDGKIPYILAMEHASWSRRGDPEADFNLWHYSTYQASSYVGEGVLSFALHCHQPVWRAQIEKAIDPQIGFLLRTQNPDGTWAVEGGRDQKRSPGVVNLLIWYDQHVRRDPRIERAVRRFDAYILNPANARKFGLLNFNPGAAPKGAGSFDVGTSLTGRAVADILLPGVDSRW